MRGTTQAAVAASAMESGPPEHATRTRGAASGVFAVSGSLAASGSVAMFGVLRTSCAGRIGARAFRISVRAWATVESRGPELWRTEGGIAVLVRGARAQPSVRAGAILQWWAAFRLTPTRDLVPRVRRFFPPSAQNGRPRGTGRSWYRGPKFCARFDPRCSCGPYSFRRGADRKLYGLP